MYGTFSNHGNQPDQWQLHVLSNVDHVVVVVVVVVVLNKAYYVPKNSLCGLINTICNMIFSQV